MTRRFIVPAFFVVDAETHEDATRKVSEAHCLINTALRDSEVNFFEDEQLPDRQVPIPEDECELPHTYGWGATLKDDKCSYCGSALFNEEGDCQQCGL